MTATPGAVGGPQGSAERTVVHLVRHGEVHNPQRVLYGRLPGYRLSDLGRQMADVVAEHLIDNDITVVTASSLQRAQETAEPIAATHGLTVGTDDRLIEAGNRFEGKAVAGGKGVFADPRMFRYLYNPFRPSWGEPYTQIVDRVLGAVDTARDQARGHEAVLVSHQLPIWIVRSALEGRRLWHDPRRRHCTLASVTSLTYAGDTLESIAYSEPAGALSAKAAPGAGA